jgi:hypothetical protein
MLAQIKMRTSILFILIFFALAYNAAAQNDSTTKVNNGKEVLLDTLKPNKNSAAVQLAKKDSVSKKPHDPRKATLRSAIIPGWGQAYNHEWWKIPIVYGALSIPAATFVYNNNWYQRTKQAYNILVNGGDTNKINSKLKGLSPESLQYYRNTFRKDRDYSVLFFLAAWALNVADATVFAHLKNFDVSRDLSLRVQPDYNLSTKSPSLGLVLNYKSGQKKLLPTAF